MSNEEEVSSSKVLALWTELCQSVAELQRDFEKNALKHNVSAGVRVRKGIRTLRKQAFLILKETLAFDKSTVEQRKSKNASKPKKSKAAPSSS